MHDLEAGEQWPAFPPDTHSDDLEHRAAANRAVAVSAIGLTITGGLELLVAVLSGSVGLLGDALHNLSDVSTSLVVFVGFRYSKRHADPAHPYGWGRAEDLAGLAVAAVVWASAIAAGVLSVHKLLQRGTTSAVGAGMVMAVVGIIGNQLVARYKHHVGHRIHSAALEADASHSWLDAIASAGAFLGLLVVALGAPWADPVAGMVVTGFIVHVGWEVTRDLSHRLTASTHKSSRRPNKRRSPQERRMCTPGPDGPAALCSSRSKGSSTEPRRSATPTSLGARSARRDRRDSRVSVRALGAACCGRMTPAALVSTPLAPEDDPERVKHPVKRTTTHRPERRRTHRQREGR